MLPGHFAVVERDLPATLELLALLMSLARDEDDIARPGRRDRNPDRLETIDLDDPVAFGWHALDDLGDYRLGILGAWVV